MPVEPIAIQPMQWASLAELHDVPPIDSTDQACMDEVRAVLARHGKLTRFALHLAHRHIALAPDEILIERPDPDGRTQHVFVGRRDEVKDARPTTWLFDPVIEAAGEAIYCVCMATPMSAGACAFHGHSQTPPTPTQEREAHERRIQEERIRREQTPVAPRIKQRP